MHLTFTQHMDDSALRVAWYKPGCTTNQPYPAWPGYAGGLKAMCRTLSATCPVDVGLRYRARADLRRLGMAVGPVCQPG